MNLPRAVWLRYQVTDATGPCSNYYLDFENSAFVLRIAAGIATFEMKIDVASLEGAERHIGDFLSSFAADALFQTGNSWRAFSFVGGDLSNGETRFTIISGHVRVVGERAEQNHRAQSPWKHHGRPSHPLVTALMERYQTYRQGRELLSVFGYFCVTALETAAGGSKDFCAFYNVDKSVRKTLGVLTTSVGTLRSARKVKSLHALRDLSVSEQFWLEAALRALIVRAGEVAGGEKSFARITMSSLPDLDLPPTSA